MRENGAALESTRRLGIFDDAGSAGALGNGDSAVDLDGSLNSGGAVQSRLGRVHVAQGGTLFLDELGELALSMQAKLLRFLQNGKVQRLGSSDVYRVDVRVVCATNVRLLELARARQFRLDLYYRLAIFPIVIPPLRERPEDVCALAEYFLAKLSGDGECRRNIYRPRP